RETHSLDFVVRQRASLHAAYRLSLEKLPHEFHECEHELREPLLDIVGVDIHPLGEDATKPFDFSAELVELGIHAHRTFAKLYGGQGPLTTPATSTKRETSASSSRFRSSASRSSAVRGRSAARAPSSLANTVPKRIGRQVSAAQSRSTTRWCSMRSAVSNVIAESQSVLHTPIPSISLQTSGRSRRPRVS